MKRVLSFAVLLALAVSAAEAPTARAAVPNRLYGTAMLNGQPAAVGTSIVALAGGKPCATVSVATLAASGTSYPYRMDVPDANADGACKPGAVLTFTIGGVTAAQTFTLDDTGAFQRLDLTAPGTPNVPAGSARSVNLAPGCNQVSSTFPDNTPPQEIALAISPMTAVAAIWVADRSTGLFRGFNPNAVDLSDLRAVNRGDLIRACVREAATLTQP